MIKFGTDGWRAIMDCEFTVERVALVAQAIADYLIQRGFGSREVIVGYDTRRNSRIYAETVCSVLSGNNIRILLPKRDIPTPLVAFTIMDRRLGGGIMITASHNPPEYNGIKFIPEKGAPALPGVTDAIERNIRSSSSVRKIEFQDARTCGLVAEFDPFHKYRRHIIEMVDVSSIRNTRMKIVHDALFGTSRGYLPSLLKDAGCEVVEINNYEDAFFGGGQPNPDEKYLGKLRASVVEHSANFGVANDGDADRIGVVDEYGNFISSNMVFSLLADYFASKKGLEKGAIIRSVATTHMVDRIAESHGLELVETPVGFKWLAKAMFEKDGLIAGEESGGACFRGHVAEKDGLLTALFLAEMVAASKKSLSHLLLDLKEKYGGLFFGRIGVEYPANKLKGIVEKLKMRTPESIAGLRVTNVNTLDGLKLTLEDGSWLLIRPSGTEPLIRIYCEATGNRNLEKILAEGKKFLME